MAEHTGNPNADDRVIDLDARRERSEAPVPGAQWDEVHGRWQHWDDVTQSWLVVGAETPVPPPAIAPDIAMGATDMAALLQDEDPDDVVIDIDRLAAPPQPVPGAQWNEVMGRWERWDDAASEWVAVPSNVDAF
ncbi:MAG: hypothetical protein ACT452_07260 [Microthrixaceae bacterium]